jgi:hypothetical protein
MVLVHPVSQPRSLWPKVAIGLIGLLLGCGVSLPAAAVLCDPLARARLQQFPWLRAGTLSDLPADGEPHRVVVRFATQDAWTTYPAQTIGEVFLRRSLDGNRITAFKAICPDNGCPIVFEPAERRFRDLCHDSTFDLEGRLLSGPSAFDLDRLEVALRGDKVWLRENLLPVYKTKSAGGLRSQWP